PNAGGPYTMTEGGSLTLDGSGSTSPDGSPLTYSWDVNGDGIFDDATGVQPTLTWSQLVALGITQGPSTFQIRLEVDDGSDHPIISSPVTLAVNDAPVTAILSGPVSINEGATYTLGLSATDP